MKIICVAGGSYKSFYFNYFVKLRRCDLLIFNFGIIYDYDICNELTRFGIVTRELMALSKKLHSVVVAGVNVVFKGKVNKSVIVCDGEKIHINKVKTGAKICIKKTHFIIGDETTDYKSNNKIILCSKRIHPNLERCSKRKIYIFCDKFGVYLVENGKLKRKFNKFSKIILK